MALTQAVTRYGVAEGIDQNGVTVFRGVPYAVPPVGPLRWKRTVPLPDKKWEGTRIFDTYGNICPQNAPANYAWHDAALKPDEDCLYLNIWTPAQTASDGLPVMVWLYGSAFMIGSPNTKLYAAESLCKKGIIVVHVTYRLNWFGFMSHPELDLENDEHVSGNYGLWDELEALRWVRDNIEAFGGDPSRVTLAGQSAGGASICALLAFPEAKGLFQGGIIESGVHDTDKLSFTMEEAEETLLRFLSEKGFGKYTLRELRNLPADALVGTKVPTWFNGKTPLRPIIDGYVQQQQSYDMFRKGRIFDLPLIWGTNAYEGNMGPRDCDYETFMKYISEYAREDRDRFLTIYPVDNQNFESIRHIIGRDKEFANLRFLASRLCPQRKSPVYHYHFAQGIPQKDGTVRMPFHGQELFYVWNHLEMQKGDPVIRKEHEILADNIGSYWCNFVKTGNPNGDGLPYWPDYSSAPDLHLRIEAGNLRACGSHYPIGTELIEKMMRRAE